MEAIIKFAGTILAIVGYLVGLLLIIGGAVGLYSHEAKARVLLLGVAGIALVIATHMVASAINGPPRISAATDCYVDWDGRSNPVVCK